MELKLVPPCINRSFPLFSVDEGQVIYALGGLKNVGRDAMQLIVNARDKGGKFTDLFDFARRVDLKIIGKRALENLTRAGSFDQLNRHRAFVFENLNALVAFSAFAHEETASAQASLFGGAQTQALEPPKLKPVELDWTLAEKLSFEHEAIGFYLSGHPLDAYLPELETRKVMTYGQLVKMLETNGTLSVRIAGTVVARQDRKSQKGTRYAFLQLSDPTGMFEAVVFSDTLTAHQELLSAGNMVVIGVEAEQAADQIKIRVQSVQAIEDVVDGGANATRNLVVHISDEKALGSLKVRLGQLPPCATTGTINLSMILRDLECTVLITLEGQFSTSTEISNAIKDIQGVEGVEVVV